MSPLSESKHRTFESVRVRLITSSAEPAAHDVGTQERMCRCKLCAHDHTHKHLSPPWTGVPQRRSGACSRIQSCEGSTAFNDAHCTLWGLPTSLSALLHEGVILLVVHSARALDGLNGCADRRRAVRLPYAANARFCSYSNQDFVPLAIILVLNTVMRDAWWSTWLPTLARASQWHQDSATVDSWLERNGSRHTKMRIHIPRTRSERPAVDHVLVCILCSPYVNDRKLAQLL